MYNFRAIIVSFACLALISAWGCADSTVDSPDDAANMTHNKEMVQSIFDAISTGSTDNLSSLIANNVVDHNPVPGAASGLQGSLQKITMFRAAFPDLKITVDDLMAAGDKVTARVTMTGTHKGEFMGVSATDRPIRVSAMETVRISDGKVVERWGKFDSLTMMRQLGVAP